MSIPSAGNSSQKTPRRQARGQKRIQQLLQAAGQVFAEVGYENATTNAIAARAGVSPGTLYQFFANKQAMAEALAADYAARDKAAHEQATEMEIVRLPLSQLVDRVIDPFLDFKNNAPGFDALFTGSVVSPELAGRIQALHEELKARVRRMITLRGPHIAPRDAETYAEVSIQVVKGLLPMALKGTPAQRKIGTRELKAVLERYLAPLDAAAAANPRKVRGRE
jgi:AcrR family transcriptional regulator